MHCPLVSVNVSPSKHVLSIEKETEKMLETRLTISTLCSRCCSRQCPAVRTGWTSWLYTCNKDAAFTLTQLKNGALAGWPTLTKQLILPLTTSSNTTHCRAAGATEWVHFLWSSCESDTGRLRGWVRLRVSPYAVVGLPDQLTTPPAGFTGAIFVPVRT